MKSSRRSQHSQRAYRLELGVVSSALLLAAAGLRCADDAADGAVNRACSALDARLRECGVLTGGRFYCDDEGWLSARRGELDEIACQYRCYADAACGAAKDWVCGLQVSTTESDLLQIAECVSECARQYGLGCEATDSAAEAVSSTASCDGRNDCVDGTDEVDCNSFACGDGQVVDRALVCNGLIDCDNRRDERANCPFFTCGDGLTLPFELVCDGSPSCPDESDEQGCRAPSERIMLDCTCGYPNYPPCGEP
jgi:hypothetical protein